VQILSIKNWIVSSWKLFINCDIQPNSDKAKKMSQKLKLF